MKKFINFVFNSNFRLLIAGYNKLDEYNKIQKAQEETNKNISARKNNLLNGFLKTKADNEERNKRGMFRIIK